MTVVEVAVAVPLNKIFHYLPPTGASPEDVIGKRVRVEFGKRMMTGYALAACESDETADFKLKEISSVLDPAPVITGEAVLLAQHISENYICSLGEALACVIPVSMKAPKRQNYKLQIDALCRVIPEICCRGSNYKSTATPHPALSRKGRGNNNVSPSPLAGEGDSPRNNEDESGAGARCERPGGRQSRQGEGLPLPSLRGAAATKQSRILTSYQQSAVELITKSISSNKPEVFLIHGITASGKTEVYLNCIEHALKLGKSAIMLIPEISLTAQFVDIVEKRFADNVGIWHSGVSNIEKYKLFSRAKSGEIKVMLGARSAVFAPFEKIGLLIIDEEHEHTYKQEQKPSYDAREIARWRAHYHDAAVVLGSATPSLESFKEAADGNIKLIEMPERIDKRSLPEVKILSLRNKAYGGSLFMTESIDAISKTLARKEQVIVFLNRRGFSPSIMCRQCEAVYQCPNCSISMVYHRNPDILKCHYCGETKKLPVVCPVCKGREITVFGSGTQKAEDELKKMFPRAKIFRLDGDTASSKENYEKAYKGIKNEEYDILLGTQMIAKGFDFPRVSLVCVVDADTSLYLPDFKSAEKTFQLITQVAGRCGRGETPGNVIVQTRYPEHYAIAHAKSHDFVSFYKAETEHRKKLLYPPYCDVAKISVRNRDEKKASSDSEKLFSALEKTVKDKELPIKLLGPAPAYIAKLHNTFRKNIIIKGDKRDILELADCAGDFRGSSGTQISIEIMPSDLI
ncbi:MAG: primosomal protein N' [Endomicrobia bacterium]|nr:primosomal protein N' [Endomicrobiia bacterium]